MRNATAEQKRALLARLLRQRTGGDGSAPLSPGQRSLWFLEKLHPGTAVYHLSHGSWLDGDLDVRALSGAVDEVVRRHAALRTSFVEVGSRPVQVISDRSRAALLEVDLSALPAGDREREAERLATEIVTRPFDLRRAPLLRVAVIRLEENRSLLSLVLHHIISDAWSFGVFSGELWTLYCHFRGRSGQPLPLPALPTQYADFTRRQLDWLGSPACEREIDFWRQRLEGAPRSLELPTARQRPAVRSSRGGEYWELLSRDQAQRLKKIGESRGATLFMTALAVYAALIARYTGRQEFLIGTSVAGRNRPELGGLIGYFVNMLALRIPIRGDLRFTDLLDRVREVTIEALSHQELPFEKLVETLQPDRDLSQDPLFQVVFDFVPFRGASSVQVPGLEQRELVIDHGTAQVDLETYLEEAEDGAWKCFVRWSADLFDAPFMIRFLRHFKNLSRSVAANPEGRISELPYLSGAETEQLLVEWNSARHQGPAYRGLLEIFDDRVAAAPNAVAAVCEERSLTYRELHDQVAGLAAWLRAQGVGREARVGIFGERDLGMLVSILAVLKAEAAWVPLDPAHPDDRVLRVLRASAVSAVVTQGALSQRLAEMTAELAATGESAAPAIYCWDQAPADSGFGDPQSEALDGFRNDPDDLAYVFYTSGSTGQPKGAMVTHRGMLNHLWSKIDLLELDSSSVVVQNASHCFDISIWQFIAPLMVGGRVVIYAGDAALDPALLLERTEHDAATILELVPSLLDAVLERAAQRRARGVPPRLEALRVLLSTGEALPVPLARRWFEQFPEIPVVNAFGPTECADDTMHHVMTAAPPATAPRVPVGLPVPGFSVHVLDRRLQLLPSGCPGQLAVSGVGVGRGYLGAPATTAAVFVPDPLAEKPGERLYLTGDLGRFTADGVLEFFGRIDSQVKVRGYRIELGEIEAALARHPEISQVAVLAISGGGGRLVAYVVSRVALEDADLRRFLAQSLPRYMVPEQFLRLPALPLNRNGKIDRRALPEPPPPASRKDHVAPRNPLEAQIAEIWQDILQVSEISVRDDFFDLGGHSLKAIQLTIRLERDLGLEVPVRQLFLTSTVAELAASLEGGDGAAEVAPIERRGDQSSYPLSVAQETQWGYLQMVGRKDRKLPEVLELEGELDRDALAAAVRDLVGRHEALRTSFAEVEGQPRQILHDMVEVELPEVALAGFDGAGFDGAELDPEERQRRLRDVLFEESRSFDLTRPPLLRIRTVRLGDNHHLLLLNVPHIVSDGWSEQLLFQDLAELYNRHREGRSSELAELSLRYVDYAAWQREQLDSPAMLEQRDFWLAELLDAPPKLELPFDRLTPGEVPELGATTALDPALASRIEELAGARGATSFMVYLAAFQAFLARWTGALDLTVGSALAGRGRPQLDELVGVFTHPVALRADLDGDPRFDDLLRNARKKTLAAIAHQDYPFYRWLEQLRRQRGDGDYVPYSVSLMPQKEPALGSFDGLEARLRLPTELFGPEPEEPLDDSAASTSAALEQLTGLGVDLTFAVFETRGSVRLILAASSGKFRGETLERILGQLIQLLDQVVRAPGCRLSEIDLWTGEAERQAFQEQILGATPSSAEDRALATALAGWTQCQSADAVAAIDPGGEVTIVDDPDLYDPYELARFLERPYPDSLGATTLVAGPALLEDLAAALGAELDERDLSLRRVVSVGSAPARGASRLSNRFELDVVLPLLEGASAGLVGEPSAEDGTGPLFVGRPLGNAPVHLLDSGRRPVPPGILGEIYLEPEAPEPGTRLANTELVATGFRGRWCSDGSLEVTVIPARDPADEAPEGAAPSPLQAAYRAPRTALERRLSIAFQKELGLPQVGVDDDFFQLGGDARSAARVAVQLGRRNVLILPGQIRRHRTIARLAPAISEAMELPTVALGVADRPPASLTEMQTLLLGAALEDPLRVVQSATLKVQGVIDGDLLRQALRALAGRHDALRARLVGVVGRYGQALCSCPDVPLATIELTDDGPAAEEAWEQAVERLRAEVDPIWGPPLRVLLGRSADRPALALAASSLAFDEASWSLLVADLAAAYAALAAGRPLPWASVSPGSTSTASSGSPAGSAPARSFYRWLAAAERLDGYRESRRDRVRAELSAGWSEARWVSRQTAPGSWQPPAGQDLEPLLVAAIGQVAPGAVEVERSRRAAAPGLPALDRTVGQFEALEPIAPGETSGQESRPDSPPSLRVRLRWFAAPSDGPGIILNGAPNPRPPVVIEGHEPDLLVSVAAAPTALTVGVAVRPGASGALSAAAIADGLVAALTDRSLAPEEAAPEDVSTFADIELEAADMDELFH